MVVDRINHQSANDATMLQAAGASLKSKEGGTYFQKLVRDLTGN